MSKKIVGIGEVLLDILPDGKKLGGAPANFAYHVSQFGFDSYVVSAIGNDELGDEIISSFEEKSLKSILQRNTFPTGTVLVTLNSDGIPQYEICEDVAWDNIEFTPELNKLAHETLAVVFGSLAQRSEVSRNTILQFLDAMPKRGGVLKVFDINLRQHFYTKEIIEISLQKCNILKINDDEIIVLSELFNIPFDDYSGICKKLLEQYSLKMVILTCGSKGSYVFTDDGKSSYIDTPKVQVVDTVGAGDSFMATFTASILNNLSIEDAHRLAVDVAAFVCTQSGAMPKLDKRFLQH